MIFQPSVATLMMLLISLFQTSFVLAFAASTPRSPNPVIKTMAQGMGLLKPVFGVEAKLQANILGGSIDRESVEEEINAEISASDIVIYTYGLSPFSSEATAILDGAGVSYTNLELGKEWFLLNGKDSVKRVCLSERVANTATSLPKVFIKGECIGGCAELAELVESGEFQGMIRKATPAKTSGMANPFAKLFGQ